MRPPEPGAAAYYQPPPPVFDPGAQVLASWSRRGPWTAAGGGNGPTMGIRSIETYADYTIIETVEVIKRPGQSLGFYIREGNGVDRHDGVFISRIAPGSAVERNGLLRVGEEIVAVDAVDITRMSLDDVVILMSIPRRLILTVRTRKSCCSKNLSCPALLTPTSAQPPPMPPAVQPSVTRPPQRRGEHQRHWSTASVVDLADNYAEDGTARTTTLRRAEAETRGPAATRPAQTERWPAYFDIAVAAAAVHPAAPRLPGPAVTRSWDRRTPAAAGEMVSAGVARRPPRYPLDYSSDTDAQFVDQQLPVEWRRRPPAQRRVPPPTAAAVEVGEVAFEPEWPPTINGKRRRPVGAAPPRVEIHPAADLHGGKRFNSDSELNGFDKLFGTSAGDGGLVEGDAATAAELLRPGDRCNSLPDIENGAAGAGDELRHWLQKLDKLSSELQDFNSRPAPSSGNFVRFEFSVLFYASAPHPHPHRAEALSDDARLTTSVCLTSV